MQIDSGRWRQFEAGRELDMQVAEQVYGWQWFRYEGNGEQHILAPSANAATLLQLGDHVGTLVPPHSANDSWMWRVVEHMAYQMDQHAAGYRWLGPVYKPVHSYLTHEGWPLGTSCWYVRVEAGGYIWNVCHADAPVAVCWAALEATAVLKGTASIDARWRAKR